MNPEERAELTRAGEERFQELLNRPWEWTELEMELKKAMELKDVGRCRELLREKGQWLAKFKGYQLTELMDVAIKAEDAANEFLGLLLEAGVPPNCVYDNIGASYQHTPLVTAARCGRLDLILKLVAHGANPFWASPTGATALSEVFPSRASQAPACDSPKTAEVREWLVQQGLRIDPACADSRRKMMWASSFPNSWPDIAALIELGIPIRETGWTPFMHDLAMGIAEARTVADLSADELSHRDAWNRTPFLLAVAAGDLELAKALFERGGDIHAASHCGATALHLAAENNHCYMIEWLLENGFPLDARDQFGNSALHSAVGRDSVDAASLLLQKGADVKERDENSYGLIHEVSFEEDLVMLKLLLGAGADVNDISGGGCWPLYDACHSGNAEAVSFLLQAGADPNLTSTGATALFAAVIGNEIECVRLLIDAGAEVNATDCDGWTCLFSLGSEPVADYLLEHGADPRIADECDVLPEDWARIPFSVRAKLRETRIRF
jgi:ankyrin repeat protein